MSNINITLSSELFNTIQVGMPSTTSPYSFDVAQISPTPITIGMTLPGPRGFKGDTGDAGNDGREVQLTSSDGYIKWRYVGESTWTNLISISAITGPQGMQGIQGVQGNTGTNGTDGQEILLRSSGGYIQWKYESDVSWTNLVDLSTLRGSDGADGADGQSATIAIGTVTTGSVGSSATVTNVGTSSAAVLNFNIPKGTDGTNGKDGADGVGIPTGGTTNQILRKVDNTNYNTQWHTLSKSDVGLGNVVNADTSTTVNVTDSTNKRFVTDIQRAVLQNTSGTNTGDQDLSGYELKLPDTPSNPEQKFLNGNRQWAEMTFGSGGYAGNVYMTNQASTINFSYKQSSAVNDGSETEVSATANNNEVLLGTYLFESQIGVTTVDPGVWRATMYSKASSSNGIKLKIEVFKRSAGGTETTLFSAYSNNIVNTTYQINVFESNQSSFAVLTTDRLGHRLYACNTSSTNITLYYLIGDGNASYINTPLALRHAQLRGKNDEPAYQHVTSDEKTKLAGIAEGATLGADWNTNVTNKPTIGSAAAKEAPSSGNATSAQVVLGNDTRLSDARTPTAHNHPQSDITNLTTDLAGKVAANAAITGATKTKVTYDSKGLVTAGSDATTADITDSTDKRYVTDAQRTVLNNTSGTNTGDQTLPTDATIVTSDVTTNNASITKHGWAPKATAPSSGLINVVGIANGESVYSNKALFDATAPSTQAYGDSASTGSATVAARRDHKHAMPAAVTDATISMSDITTNNASTSKHGLFPKLPTPAGKYLKDDMTWDTPAGGTGGVTDGDKGDITVSGSGATWTIDDGVVTETKMSLSDVTTGNSSTVKHGLLPRLDGNTTTYLRGDGTWATPAGGSGSGSPGGTEGQVQYNSSGSFAGASKVEIENGYLRLECGEPTTPAENGVNVFVRQIAGRCYPAYIGPSGIDSSLQPLLARNKIGYWCPPGNAVTTPGILGLTAPTTTSFTATARNVATTNLFSRMRRLGFVTSTTAGTVGHFRLGVYQFTVGSSSTNLGGFTYIIRFGISDAAAVSGARMFMGMRNSATPSNVEPNTLTYCFGIGHGASDTNMKFYYGGSAAQTPIDLGADFPANTLSVDVYELALFSPPSSGDVSWQVTRLNTGHVASGTIVNTGLTVLPNNTTLIAPWGYRTNNATALAVGIDVMSMYIETDY